MHLLKEENLATVIARFLESCKQLVKMQMLEIAHGHHGGGLLRNVPVLKPNWVKTAEGSKAWPADLFSASNFEILARLLDASPAAESLGTRSTLVQYSANPVSIPQLVGGG